MNAWPLHVLLAGGMYVTPAAAGPDCAQADSLSPAGQHACRVGAAPEDEAVGWTSVDIAIRQGGSMRVRCSFGLAHWYELTVQPQESGASLDVRLIARARTNEVALVNDVGARMRLEQISCGASTTPRQNWQVLPIDALRKAPAAAEIDCAPGSSGLTCALTAR